MPRRTALYVALAGAVLFSLLAGFGFPLAMSAIETPLAAKNFFEAAGMFKFSMTIFGGPAALVGLLLAKRIVLASSFGAFVLGVFLVLATHLLGAMVAMLYVSYPFSLDSFFADGAKIALVFLIFDMAVFKGMPFLLGGLAALALRAGFLFLDTDEI